MSYSIYNLQITKHNECKTEEERAEKMWGEATGGEDYFDQWSRETMAWFQKLWLRDLPQELG